jgi:hypothetical protein
MENTGFFKIYFSLLCLSHSVPVLELVPGYQFPEIVHAYSIYIFAYTYVYTGTYTYVHIYVCMYVYMHAYIQTK